MNRHIKEITCDDGLYDKYLDPAMQHMMEDAPQHIRIERAYNQLSIVLIEKTAFPSFLSQDISRLNELGMKNLNKRSGLAFAASNNLTNAEKVEFCEKFKAVYSELYKLKGQFK